MLPLSDSTCNPKPCARLPSDQGASSVRGSSSCSRKDPNKGWRLRLPLLGPSVKLLPSLEGRMQVKLAANRKSQRLWRMWWSGDSFRSWFSPFTKCPGVQTWVLMEALLPTEPHHLTMKGILTNCRRKVNLWSREVKVLQRSVQNGGAVQANQSKSYPDGAEIGRLTVWSGSCQVSASWVILTQPSFTVNQLVPPHLRLPAPPMLSFHSVFD